MSITSLVYTPPPCRTERNPNSYRFDPQDFEESPTSSGRTLSLRSGSVAISPSSSSVDLREESASPFVLGGELSPKAATILRRPTSERRSVSPAPGSLEDRVDRVVRPYFAKMPVPSLDERWEKEVSIGGKVSHYFRFHSANKLSLMDVDAAPVDTSVLSSADASWLNDVEEFMGKHVPSYSTYQLLVSSMVEMMKDDPDRAQAMSLELVAKVLSYGRLHPHTEVPIPTLIDGNLVLAWYHPLLLDLKDGNAAYLFVPTDSSRGAQPILSFRGTCPQHASGSIRADGGFRAVLNNFLSFDMTPEIDVGRNVINVDRKKLALILQDAEKRYGKVTLTGHSLGGALAGRLAMEGDNYRFIEKVVTFNAPGVSKGDVRRFDELVAKGKISRDFGEAYTTQGDRVGNGFSFENFLGRKFVITPSDTRPKNLDTLHGQCILGLKAKIEEVRAPHHDAVSGVIIKRIMVLPIYVSVWILSRLFWLIISSIIESVYALEYRDITRSRRHHIDVESEFAMLYNPHTPVELAERRAHVYYALFPIPGELGYGTNHEEAMWVARHTDLHTKRYEDSSVKRFPEHIGGVAGKVVESGSQEAYFFMGDGLE